MANDKFSRVAALRPARKRPAISSGADREPAEDGDRLAQLLGAEVCRNRFGAHLSLRRWYSTPEMSAPDDRALALLLPADPQRRRSVPDCAADPEKWLFLDTETTGLAGGTGTYAFLVGVAWWDAGGLQVEQFFMRDYDEEHSLLLELSQRMKDRPVLVTFNGKSFDWPLLETRYRMTRSITPRAPVAHLDLLHPARQLWRLRLGSVRLKELERHVLAGEERALEWSREDDIDSSLIPQMYFDYLRGGAAEPLAGVFRHNQMDLRGLAALAGKVLSLLGDGGATHGLQEPLDLYGLSRLLQRRGETSRARAACESALSIGLPADIGQAAQRDLALAAKHSGEFGRANALWEELARNGGPLERCRALEQLAIHHEHRAKDVASAMQTTREGLQLLRKAKSSRWALVSSAKVADFDARFRRRLLRLERLAARQAPDGHSSLWEDRAHESRAPAAESNPGSSREGKTHAHRCNTGTRTG